MAEKITKLCLTTWERMILISISNEAPNAGLAVLRKGIAFVEAMELTEEERSVVGYVEVSNTGAQWENRKHVFDVILNDDAEWYYRRVVRKTLQTKKWSQAQARLVLSLYEKLGIEEVA